MRRDTLLIYLSGPMSGMPNLNQEAFSEAAEFALANGYNVYNPAAKDEGTRQANMKTDIENILRCDQVWVLDGWQTSAGARLEVMLAHEIGMPVQDARTQTPTDLGIFNTGGKGDPRFHALLQQIAD